MVVSKEMEDAVDQKKREHLHLMEAGRFGLATGRFDGDDEVAEEVWVEWHIFSLTHREGEDIGGFIPVEVMTVQLPNLSIVHQENTQFSLRKSQAHQDLLDQPSYLF